MPKDDRLNDIIGLLNVSSQRFDRLDSRIVAIETSLCEMRVAFDHSMQFFESRLSSVDAKLDLPMVPKDKLQADGDHGKVAVLKTMFEKTSKKIEKSLVDIQLQIVEQGSQAHCQTETDVAETFAQTVEQGSHAHCQTIVAEIAVASIQTVATTTEAVAQTDAPMSPLIVTTGVASIDKDQSSGQAQESIEALCLSQLEKVRAKVSNC